jgi:hypothetical protein
VTQLPVGPPTKPPTPLTPEGIKAMTDRLGLLLDTTDFGDEMAPAVKNIAEAVITQDMPALLEYIQGKQDCEACASIHRVHHVKQQTQAQSLRAMRDPYQMPDWFDVHDEAGF